MQIKTLNQSLFQTVLVWHSMSQFVLHKAFAEFESRSQLFTIIYKLNSINFHTVNKANRICT